MKSKTITTLHPSVPESKEKHIMSTKVKMAHDVAAAVPCCQGEAAGFAWFHKGCWEDVRQMKGQEHAQPQDRASPPAGFTSHPLS